MKIFRKEIHWHRLFDTVDAAKANLAVGSVRTFEAGSTKICLARTAEGFFAVNDRCPHNGASLGHGHCTSEGSVVCPLHRYHFDLRTGRAKSGLGDVVRTYPVQERADGLFVGFEKTRLNF